MGYLCKVGVSSKAPCRGRFIDATGPVCLGFVRVPTAGSEVPEVSWLRIIIMRILLSAAGAAQCCTALGCSHH